MSENITLPQASPSETAGCAAPPPPSQPAATIGTAEHGIASALPSALALTLPPGTQTTTTVGTAEHGIASASPLAFAPALPPDTHALLDLIGHGLAPEADDTTRDAARELWARFAQMIAAAAPMMPAAPAPSAPMPAAPVMLAAPAPAVPAPAAPVMSAAPVMPAIPLPTSPIAMAARTLRQLSPDQLLELLLQRLRTALPAGATVPTPKGIQFQLVPVTPPGSR